ncbi:hypothetical protein [Kribbella sp. NPDC004875]
MNSIGGTGPHRTPELHRAWHKPTEQKPDHSFAEAYARANENGLFNR